MNDREMIEKWIAVFGKDLEETMIEDHVTSEGNLLWHIFTWGNVPCMEEDEARKAFDALQYTEAFRFCGGYSNQIEDLSIVGKTSAKEMDEAPESDVYLVAKDFAWTYVRTHEPLGPYLCIRK